MALLEEAGIVCGETVVHVANTWIPSADRKFYGQNRGKEATRFLVLGAFGTGRLNIVKVKKDGTPSQSPNGLHGIIEVAHLVKAEATP